MQRQELVDLLAGATLKMVGVCENEGKVTSIMLHLDDGRKVAIGFADGPELPVRVLESDKAIREKIEGATTMEELRKIETEVFGDSPIKGQ